MPRIPSARRLLVPILLGGSFVLGWPLISNFQAAQKEKHLQRAREIQALSDKAATRQLAAVEAYKQKVDGIVTRIFAQEEWRIQVASTSLTGWKESMYLSYLLAYDSLTGGATAGEFIGQTVNPVFATPLRLALPLIHREFDILSTELDLAAREYAVAVKRVSDPLPNGGKVADFSATQPPALPTQESMKGAVQTSLNAGLLGVDAVFLPQLSGQIGTVLQAVVNRLTTTLAASGTLVAADGPLPVGDMIGALLGVGGSIWSAHDLHEARTKLGPAVRTKLYEQYRNQQISLRKTAIEQAYLLLKTYEHIQPTRSNDERL